MVTNEEVSSKIVIEDEETQIENEEALTMEVEEEAYVMNSELQDRDVLIPEWDALVLEEYRHDENVGPY